MKYLFTCGGTAGHINPALAIASKIQELDSDAEILFVGAKGNMEMELVPREGFEIKAVTITNLRRSLAPKMIVHNLKTAKNVLTALSESKKIIKQFRPNIAIGTGGYVCYPVLKAAASLGVPTMVHESNAVPGLTTKLLASSVDKILVGFEDSAKNYKQSEKVVVTGTPVRGKFDADDKEQAKISLGLAKDKPLLVSVWGSLGSDYMNEVFAELMCALERPEFSVIHATGKRGYKKFTDKLKAADKMDVAKDYVREYIYDMPTVMTAADLIICRSGASTLSELAVQGKPAILIPSPNVTNNHQEKNARVLENAGAAKVLLEGEFTPVSLNEMICEILYDKALLAEMSKNMKNLGNGDCTTEIANLAIKLAKN